MINRNPLKKLGLDDVVKEFDLIYGSVNEERDIERIWLHGVEHASRLHENLRLAEYENSLDHIAGLFCWLSALTTKASKELHTKQSLLDIVLSKYPRRCFYCGARKCKCTQKIGRKIENLSNKETLRHAALARAKGHYSKLKVSQTEPKTLDGVVRMYFSIYDHINFRTTIDTIMAHLQEEVGEVATCLNDFTDKPETRLDEEKLREFEDEIADVVTWIIALIVKIDYLLPAGANYLQKTEQILIKTPMLEKTLKTRSVGLGLASIIWYRYKNIEGTMMVCSNCKQRPCGLWKEKREDVIRL